MATSPSDAPASPACPRCHSVAVRRGGVGPRSPGAVQTQRFHPEGLRVRLKLSVPWLNLDGSFFYACLQCGLIWTETSAAAIRQVLLDHGTDATRSVINGLPDSVIGVSPNPPSRTGA